MLQDEFPNENATYVVLTSETGDKHSRCQQHREVNAVIPKVPQFMHWSKRPITWSRDDHPAVMPLPGAYAMVLDSTFSTERQACRFSRILIDGGSNINILYRETMEKLGIKGKQLQPSRTMFHGIVLGLSCSPIGKIKIDVLFGDKTHFRREPISFEVVDLDKPYHAVLDRPVLAKFMMVPHYLYLKSKMSGPKGIITIVSKKSLECAAANSRLAESLVIAEEKRLLNRAVAMASKQLAIPSVPKDVEVVGSFQPAKETKKIILDLAHLEQYAVVGANLDNK